MVNAFAVYLIIASLLKVWRPNCYKRKTENIQAMEMVQWIKPSYMWMAIWSLEPTKKVWVWCTAVNLVMERGLRERIVHGIFGEIFMSGLFSEIPD